MIPEAATELPGMSLSEHVVQDYAATSLSLKAHPVSFFREKLDRANICPSNKLSTLQDKMEVRVAGLVLVRQRPGTAKGVCFMTIEDETGVANLVIFQNLFDLYQREILQARLIMAEGIVQIEGEVIHVIVHRLFNISRLLRDLTPAKRSDLPVLTLAYTDETSKPTHTREGKSENVFHEGRNFK